MPEDQIQVTLLDWMGDDTRVADAARVSFKKQQLGHSKEDNDRLIKYLAKHEHTSPFGHCFASFHVKAPIFVCRQLVKHKFLRMNEVSRRYVDTDVEFYIPSEWRGRAKDKKQGSSGVVKSLEPTYLHINSLGQYEALITDGVAPEQARMVLPLSLMTEWWWSGSLDAFADMYNLRIKEDTQYESRLVAKQIGEKMLEKYPVAWGELTCSQ